MKAFKCISIALAAMCSVMSVQSIRPNLFFLQGLAAPDSPYEAGPALKGAGNATLWSAAAFCLSGPPGSALAGTAVACHAAKSMHMRRQLHGYEDEDAPKYSECSSDTDIYDAAKIGTGLVISAASTMYIVREQADIKRAILQAIIVAMRK